MKIVFVITNLAGGGAERIVLTLAAGLLRRGHIVDVVLLENRIEHSIPEGVEVFPLTEKATRGWLGKRLLARRLRSWVMGTGRADLVVSALPFANEVSILAGLSRHWCRVDNTLSVEIDKLAISSPRKAQRRSARYRKLLSSRPLIAISDGMYADLRERMAISGRIEKIPNPFDLDAIRVAAKMPEPHLPQRPYVIHVGRFNVQKRHDLLLDAWKDVTSDHLLVLLTSAEPALQKMIRDRGLDDRVSIAGFQRNPYPWIAGADLLVLSSDHEGLPGVLIEALACGTPAVSTDCPSGPREILSSFPECLVPCGNSGALAATISNCLTAPPNVDLADLSMFCLDSVVMEYERLAQEP